MTPTEILQAIEKAGVSITEASKLLPLSRATLHNWKSGATHGDALRIQLASGYARLLLRAVELKKLPLHDDTPRSERLPLIRRILADVKKTQ